MPSRQEIIYDETLERLKRMAWYYAVESISGLDCPTHIERAVKPETFHERGNPPGGYVYPCVFSKIKKGEKDPGEELIRRTNEVYPGTRAYNEYPFWVVANTPFCGIKILYQELTKLRPDIADLLFEHIKKGDPPIRRRLSFYETTDILSQGGDLDSLTACIGLFQEAIYFETEEFTRDCLEAALNILPRVLSVRPFRDIRYKLFDYFKESYVCEFRQRGLEPLLLSSSYIDERISYYDQIVSLSQDLRLMKRHKPLPPDCFYLFERYIPHKNLHRVTSLLNKGNTKQAKCSPEVKKLRSSLHNWEAWGR